MKILAFSHFVSYCRKPIPSQFLQAKKTEVLSYLDLRVFN